MGINKSNKTAMKMMEHWTTAETPKVMSGHQTHRPIVPGGRGLSKEQRGAGKYDRDGIKHKVRAAAFAVIAQKRAARRAAGQKKK